MPVSKLHDKGFTLIELIVGIVALSGALLILTGVLIPQAEKSTNPWFQVRSAELAQSIMNEINARRFDENSPASGELARCDESGGNACIADLPACSGTGPYPWVEEISRDLYDDIDDFHCLNVTGDQITNIENGSLQDIYRDFSVEVFVTYAGADLGLANKRAKKILVSVTPPKGSTISYSSYRTNY